MQSHSKNKGNILFVSLILFVATFSFAIQSSLVFASVASFSANDFCKQNGFGYPNCVKKEEDGEHGSISCPVGKIIQDVYVHAGDGQTVYKLPHTGFTYSFSNGGRTATVNVTTHQHDLSWLGVTCSTATPTPTPVITPTPTPVITPTPTPVITPTPTPVITPTPTPVITPTPTPVITPTPTPVITPTPTPVITPTPTPVITPTPTPVITPTPTPVITPTPTPNPCDGECEPTPTPTPSETPGTGGPTPTPTTGGGGKVGNMDLHITCTSDVEAVYEVKENGKGIQGITVHFKYENETKTVVTNSEGKAFVSYGRRGESDLTANPEGLDGKSLKVTYPKDCPATGGRVLGASTEIKSYAATGTATQTLMQVLSLVSILSLASGSYLYGFYKKAE